MFDRVGHAEQRHDRLADVLVDHAAMAVNGRLERREAAVEELQEAFRRHRAGDVLEPGHPGEHHGRLSPLAAARRVSGPIVRGVRSGAVRHRLGYDRFDLGRAAAEPRQLEHRHRLGAPPHGHRREGANVDGLSRQGPSSRIDVDLARR
jgi:hypothetical protein